jgi:hypothetical protein
MPTVAVQRKPQMTDHRVCSAIGDKVDGSPNIDQPRDGAERHAVVKRHDDSPAGIPIHNTFQTNLFSSHNHNLPRIFE